jgi:large subunit ribosomal protein L29
MLSVQELKTLSKKELLKELEQAKPNMVKIRIGVKTKHQKDTSAVEKTKRYIARIKTILKEMELEEIVDEASKKAV